MENETHCQDLNDTLEEENNREGSINLGHIQVSDRDIIFAKDAFVVVGAGKHYRVGKNNERDKVFKRLPFDKPNEFSSDPPVAVQDPQ